VHYWLLSNDHRIAFELSGFVVTEGVVPGKLYMMADVEAGVVDPLNHSILRVQIKWHVEAVNVLEQAESPAQSKE